MRPVWRGRTDSAASVMFRLALTSIKTNRPPRRAMISISPTGVRKPREIIRKPFILRDHAASVSAKRPNFSAV